jgi:hypothetical protein
MLRAFTSCRTDRKAGYDFPSAPPRGRRLRVLKLQPDYRSRCTSSTPTEPLPRGPFLVALRVPVAATEMAPACRNTAILRAAGPAYGPRCHVSL